MDLGEKLKNARLEAGLSQRQLCGEEITRNMLSQIEHGSARPSMDTLRYLASRLGKPVSYFLEEEAACSPNQVTMENARAAFDRGDFEAVLDALKDFREPDAIFGREREVLEIHSLLGAAHEAIRGGRDRYARELLEKAGERKSPYTAELERKRLLLLARIEGSMAQLCGLLPSLDEELLLRARGALEQGDGIRAGELLDAAEDKTAPQWNYLRGEAWLLQNKYAQAARCYHCAEEACADLTIPRLEACYRELGDYQKAYFYACQQRDGVKR